MEKNRKNCIILKWFENCKTVFRKLILANAYGKQNYEQPRFKVKQSLHQEIDLDFQTFLTMKQQQQLETPFEEIEAV